MEGWNLFKFVFKISQVINKVISVWRLKSLINFSPVKFYILPFSDNL